MTRTCLKNRILPSYTKGEEIFNSVSHIVGGAWGIFTLVLCIIVAATKGDAISMTCGIIFGVSMIALYTVSSIYHALPCGMAKKVFQVLDHCIDIRFIKFQRRQDDPVQLGKHIRRRRIGFGFFTFLCIITAADGIHPAPHHGRHHALHIRFTTGNTGGVHFVINFLQRTGGTDIKGINEIDFFQSIHRSGGKIALIGGRRDVISTYDKYQKYLCS